jgi:hypothetical protein
MLVLSAKHLINRGANRDCYQHPDDPGKCIKLNRSDGGGKRDGMNEIEYEHHAELAERLGEAFYQFAPRCFGIVETNLGKGPCFEMIRDADGQCSTRLRDYINASGCTLEHAYRLIDPLEAFVKTNRLALFDVNFNNLLVRSDADGQERLVVIDWKGPRALREFVPLSRIVPWVGRMKTARRFKRLRQRVQHLTSKNAQTNDPNQ